MAFNIQFPNNTNFSHVNYFVPELRKNTKNATFDTLVIGWNSMTADSMYSYAHKMTDISPSLCFQSDVFLPNARAAVQSATCEISPDSSSGFDGRFVMGCKGHQVQNDFSLQPRIAVAIPLVQYPAFKLGFSIKERDICAVPVLNWEKYITTIKHALRRYFAMTASSSCSASRKNSYYNPDDNHKLMLKKSKWDKKYANIPIEERPPLEDEESEDSESSSLSDSEYSDSDDDCGIKLSGRELLKRKLFKIDEDLSLTPEQKKLRKQKLKLENNIWGKGSKRTEKSRKKQSGVKLPKVLKRKYESIKKKELENEGMVPPETLKKIKNMPELRIEATWNYLYGGSNGACCVVQNQNRTGLLDVFVGNKTQLRKIQLKESRSPTHSYTVESVWEEEESSVPTNVKPGREEPLSDLVFQVVPNKFNILGVRRGKSVDIYDNSNETPYLLDTIPNICYGTKDYDGWTKHTSFDVIKDPLLFGLDFNPQFSPEFITIDENRQIRIGDFYQESTISSSRLDKLSRHWPNLQEWPKYQNINNACGVRFCQNGHTFITWGDSKVFLGDRRDSSYSRSSLSEIFDARGSTSTLSWSDQKFFNDTKIELNEYISAITTSRRDFYYYVGTTARLLLMDMRVPGQPVLKSSHGMKSAASQLETYTDDNFEIIMAASQRVPSTFCMITDHGHVTCVSRPNCEAKNPILQCLPRHLSSSSEFFDAVIKSGLTCQSEADYQRCKTQSNAWTTGITLVKSPASTDPRLPPGIVILTSNSFGDLYYQELVQKSTPSCTPLSTKDDKFTEFVKQWRNSMSSSYLEYLKPSLNRWVPTDNSLAVETCARSIRRMTKVRNKTFNSLVPDDLTHHLVLEHQPNISKQLELLRVTPSQSDLAKKFYDVWDEDEDESTESVLIKEEEIIEGDGNIWNEEENNYDVHVLEPEAQSKDSHVVHIEDEEESDYEAEGLETEARSNDSHTAHLVDEEMSSVNSSDSEDRTTNLRMNSKLSGTLTVSDHSGQGKIFNHQHDVSNESGLEEEEEKMEPVEDVFEIDDGQADLERSKLEVDLQSEQSINDQIEEVEMTFEESKPSLRDNDDNTGFERLILSRLPLQTEEEEYDCSSNNYSERRSFPNDPLSYDYDNEPYNNPASSSQTSTIAKHKSIKKPNRSGF